MKIQDVLPVLISFVVIILVAVLQKQNKLAAAIITTMPLTAPLALWIVYSASEGSKEAMTEFTASMLWGVVPMLVFLVIVWLTARAGLKLGPMLGIGYGAWAVGVVILVGLKKLWEA